MNEKIVNTKLFPANVNVKIKTIKKSINKKIGYKNKGELHFDYLLLAISYELCYKQL